MTKELKDYLPFYLGCECMIGDLNWKPQNIAPEDRQMYTDPDFGKPIKSTIDLHAIQAFGHKMKPILRPLSDITEVEGTDVCMILCETETCYNNPRWLSGRLMGNLPANLFTLLLKRGFDLFNLIPEKLAIDKTKMQ